MDRGEERIYLSRIFDWFANDFESKGGVIAFLTQYAPERDRPFLKKGSGKISYLVYNWDLNKK